MKFDVKGFRDFILRGNVVDLAVAVVIGMAFNKIVQAFIADIVTPLIGLIFGGAPFGSKHFTIRHQAFLYGDLINQIITFIVIAAVIYFFVVQPVGSLMAKFNPPVPDEPVETTECRDCLSTIPAAALRCAYCTVEQ
jgi:large conductance mechanosensitive channel